MTAFEYAQSRELLCIGERLFDAAAADDSEKGRTISRVSSTLGAGAPRTTLDVSNENDNHGDGNSNSNGDGNGNSSDSDNGNSNGNDNGNSHSNNNSNGSGSDNSSGEGVRSASSRGWFNPSQASEPIRLEDFAIHRNKHLEREVSARCTLRGHVAYV